MTVRKNSTSVPELSKECRKCGEQKPEGEFALMGRGKRRSCCSPCRNADRAEHAVRKVAEASELPQSKACSTCKLEKPLEGFVRNKSSVDGRHNQCKVCRREYTQRPETKELVSFHSTRRNLKRKYGLTVDQYEAMLDAQGGLCAICRGEQVNVRRMAVDHCHDTGKIRGLLCNPCNAGLGQFKDDPDRMRIAIRYLEEHKNA